MTSFRKINNQDNIEMIATWIYQTEYSFNRLFFNDSIRAVTGIERLIMSDSINPYHRKFITNINAIIIFTNKLSYTKL